MGKHYESTSTFFYSWDQVSKAFWKRYPNPHSTHVLSEDTLFREVRGDALYSRRLLTKTNRVPKWGERFVKNTIVSIIEESYVNPKEQTIVTYTRNIGYNRVMGIIEKVVYTPSAENPNHTTTERSAWIDSQIFGFRRAIETFGLDRFRKNCHKAVLGFNYVMNILYPADVRNKQGTLGSLAQGTITNLDKKPASSETFYNASKLNIRQRAVLNTN